MQINTTEDNILKISGTLDIAVAGELHNALRAFLDTSQNPILDLSDVDACDVSGLQLLYSARTTARRLKKALLFAGLPSPVETAAASAGLATADWITPL